MQRKKTYFKKIRTALARAGEFPLECTGAYPSIELLGNCEMRVYGCTRIVEYTRTRIAFESRELSVVIDGCDLLMSDFTAGGVIIFGKISHVGLE